MPVWLCIWKTRGIREIERSDGLVYIEAQAGEIWHDFVLYTVELGLSGLENLSLIPGTSARLPCKTSAHTALKSKMLSIAFAALIWIRKPLSSFPMLTVTLPIVKLFKQEGKGRYVIVSVVFSLKRAFCAELGLWRFGGSGCRTKPRPRSNGQRCFRCSVCNPQQ